MFRVHLFILVTQCSRLLSFLQAGGPSVLEQHGASAGDSGILVCPPGTSPPQRYHRAAPLAQGKVLAAHAQQKLKLRIFLMQIFKKWRRNLICNEHETSGASQHNSTASLPVRLGKVPSPETGPTSTRHKGMESALATRIF